MADTQLRNIKKNNKRAVLARVVETMRGQKVKGEYTEAVGRRKTSTARVRLTPAKENEMMVNGLPVVDYFRTDRLTGIATASLNDDSISEKYHVSVLVRGSGVNAQAEAIRLGVARALVDINEESRTALKHKGYLKRDPRSVERKKFGLRKARKAPTWVKR